MKRVITLSSALLLQSESFSQQVQGEAIVFLHGLCRTPRSMMRLEKAFRQLGYWTINDAYPSRKYCVEELSVRYVGKSIEKAEQKGASKIHFITHSMGGILLRQYLAQNDLRSLGRVVMIAPPSKGSEVVDKIGHWKLFQLINGPAGRQLGTGEAGVWNTLPDVDYEVGVIAGSRSINWINSMMIPGKDDGKVSIERTRCDGMGDFKILAASHPILLWKKETINQTAHFIREGVFY